MVYVNELQHLWADLDQPDPLEVPHAESMEIARNWVEQTYDAVSKRYRSRL